MTVVKSEVVIAPEKDLSASAADDVFSFYASLSSSRHLFFVLQSISQRSHPKTSLSLAILLQDVVESLISPIKNGAAAGLCLN